MVPPTGPEVRFSCCALESNPHLWDFWSANDTANHITTKPRFSIPGLTNISVTNKNYSYEVQKHICKELDPQHLMKLAEGMPKRLQQVFHLFKSQSEVGTVLMTVFSQYKFFFSKTLVNGLKKHIKHNLESKNKKNLKLLKLCCLSVKTAQIKWINKFLGTSSRFPIVSIGSFKLLWVSSWN